MQSVFTSPLPCLLAEGVSASSDRRGGGVGLVHFSSPSRASCKTEDLFLFPLFAFPVCHSFMLTGLLMQFDASPMGDVS